MPELLSLKHVSFEQLLELKVNESEDWVTPYHPKDYMRDRNWFGGDEESK